MSLKDALSKIKEINKYFIKYNSTKSTVSQIKNQTNVGTNIAEIIAIAAEDLIASSLNNS